jgi:acyl-coenzyme A synthetase/AMP-(fatty) acid ligase
MGRLLDAAHGDRSMWSDLRLIINSGAPLLGEVAARAEEECGCPILSVYGATDGMVPVITATEAPAELRRSRVGRLMDGHQLRIIDDQGREVPPGTIGEICAFGPGMAFGYVDNPQEMVRAWDGEGWWHSGDLGLLDEDGYLRVVGRRKEMILRGGVNISPLEIEELLNQHPDVVEAVVVPIPHPDLLEQACAVVIPTAGSSPTLGELNAFLTDRGLARFKLPERLELCADIPRTKMQKIDRMRLCEDIGRRVASEIRAS